MHHIIYGVVPGCPVSVQEKNRCDPRGKGFFVDYSLHSWREDLVAQFFKIVLLDYINILLWYTKYTILGLRLENGDHNCPAYPNALSLLWIMMVVVNCYESEKMPSLWSFLAIQNRRPHTLPCMLENIKDKEGVCSQSFQGESLIEEPSLCHEGRKDKQGETTLHDILLSDSIKVCPVTPCPAGAPCVNTCPFPRCTL